MDMHESLGAFLLPPGTQSGACMHMHKHTYTQMQVHTNAHASAGICMYTLHRTHGSNAPPGSTFPPAVHLRKSHKGTCCY